MTLDERAVAWHEVMDTISDRIHGSIDGFAVTIVLDSGATVLYGADFSHNPKVRRQLVYQARRVIREIRHLEKHNNNITAIQGKEILR